MGLSGISIWQLLIVLAIVVVLFGTKRLRTLGSDLGGMLKGFKNSMSNDGSNDGNSDEKNEAKKDSVEAQPLTDQQKIAQLEQQIVSMKKTNEKSDPK